MTKLLATENITKSYYLRKNSTIKTIKALDSVSLSIEKGKSLALIGESGSGKSTFAKAISLLEPIDSGEIYFKGKNVNTYRKRELEDMRRNIQMIFQSSSSIFDPTYRIDQSIKEVVRNHYKVSNEKAMEMTQEILTTVGLTKELGQRYPAQLSGGQRQRANIARALVLKPELLICDEPVSSVDFSIRKQILNLLNDMKRDFNLTYLFITHDLSNVAYICDEVAIMYQGRIVEYLDTVKDLKQHIKHPYSRELFDSIPSTNPRKRKIIHNAN